MKYRYLWAVVTFLVILLYSCSGKAPKSSDTISVTPDPTPELPVEDVMDAQLTARGILPIKVGMRIVDISPAEENLYDSISTEKGYESNTYHFYLDNEERFTAYEFEAGTVSMVAANNESIVVKTGTDGMIRIGDPFVKVAKLPGVKAQWETGDDDGIWVWIWQGIRFIPDQANLPDNLVHKMYNSTVAPQASDFTPEVTVSYMGTGLPW